LEELLRQFREAWPPAFAGTTIGELSGHALEWGTIQNKRSRKEIPADCFVYSGSKVLVVRDKFLDWWGTQLNSASAVTGPQKPPRRERHAETVSAPGGDR
jgi:hypothetical protein